MAQAMNGRSTPRAQTTTAPPPEPDVADATGTLAALTLDGLAAEFGRAVLARNLAEEAEIRTTVGAEKIRFDELGEACEQRIDLIEDAAAALQATTIAGAQFQVALAYGDLSALEGALSKSGNHHEMKFLARGQSCLFSIRRLLEALDGPAFPDAVDYYMAESQDPRARLAEGLALGSKP